MRYTHRHRKLLAVAAGLGFGFATAVAGGTSVATVPSDTDPVDDHGPRPCDEVFADPDDMTDDDATDDATDDMTDDATDDATDDMVDETDPDEAPFVQVAATEWGDILVDADCAALYVFLPDAVGEVTCVGDCANAWPPLLVPEADADADVPVLADELDADLFDIAEHPEQGPMLSVNDWPLYYFAQDEEPGDLNGQGVNDIWFVVSPEGEPIEELPADAMNGAVDDEDMDDEDVDNEGMDDEEMDDEGMDDEGMDDY